MNRNSLVQAYMVLFVFTLLSSKTLFCQDIPRCATGKYPTTHHGVSNAFEKLTIDTDSKNNIEHRSEITIPVVFHVLYHSERENLTDAVIFDQLERLNKDFNGKNGDAHKVPSVFQDFVGSLTVRFCLATQGPNGEPSSGIIRKYTPLQRVGLTDNLFFEERGGSTAWNTDVYLNIWIADTGDRVTGYSSIPTADFLGTGRDGVVLNPNIVGRNQSFRYGLGRVLVHEVGHYLGLLHIWGEQEGCTSDDDVGDTPLQNGPNYGCPLGNLVSCGSMDMSMNYMDYVDDDCMYFFTKGQVERMKSVLNELRPHLGGGPNYCSNPESNVDFQAIPNPSDGLVTLNFDDSYISFGSLEVYDNLGRNVYRKEAVFTPGYQIDLSLLSPGLYYLKFMGTIEKIVII